jgi:hypothetical protein
MMNSSSYGRRLPKWLDRSLTTDALCLVVLIIYFLHFALPSLAGGFADDEMMNLWKHWLVGGSRSLLENACFWSATRPAGAIYYLPLYHFFSLNPLPYHVVQVSILAASIPVVYYLARLLASSRSVAFFAVLLVSYHARLANLVFVGSFIYDVLCGFFYFAALTYYVHIREKGLPLGAAQLLGFLMLYVCALNSKEMAVTLPVIVFIYEALKYRGLENWREFSRSNWRVAVPSLAAGLLTVPYVYGRMQSAHALAKMEAYRPKISWHGFVDSNAHFIGQLFSYALPPRMVTGPTLLVTWAVVFLYAFLRRDRMLVLMAFWVVIIPLPLAFIPLRGGACLYLLLFGWALIFADLISKAIEILISKTIVLRKGVVGHNAATFPPQFLRVFAAGLVAVALAILTQWENQRSGRIPIILNSGQKSLHLAQAFRSLNLHPASGSTILLKTEKPFYRNQSYPAFVASLVWNDHSLQILVLGQPQLSEQEIAKMNYIISFTEFEATLEHSPD